MRSLFKGCTVDRRAGFRCRNSTAAVNSRVVGRTAVIDDKIGIFTELDEDCLARYILSKNLYLQYTSLLTSLIRKRDTKEMSKIQSLQDRAFRQCSSCARDLGLTISSRCKLTIPNAENEEDFEL